MQRTIETGDAAPPSTRRSSDRRAKRAIQAVDEGPEALLQAIRRLAPEISARAGEMERARALPPDLFEKIAATGIFRMILARDFGGAEYPVPEVVPIIEELARADGSTAWTVMIGSEFPAFWERLDRNVIEPIFAADRDVMTRGAFAPRGTATRVAGGYRVNGRWPLASGSYENDWVFVGCAVMDGGDLVRDSDGAAEVRFVLLPAADVTIVDTWDSIGLRATKSNDLLIEDKLVRDERSAPLAGVKPDGPLVVRLPLWLGLGPFHLAMVLGVARGALDELATLARSKRPVFNPAIRMAEDPLVQYRVAGLEMRLAAARHFVVAESAAVWKLAVDGVPVTPLARAHFRGMTAHVHRECMAIAEEVFALAGTNVLYNDSSLQRRFRDMRAACQHIVASAEIFRPLGALVLGETPPMLAAL